MPNRYSTLSLQAKLLLAAISASSYWIVDALADRSAAFNEFLSQGNAGRYLIGIALGALVMAPYVSSPQWRVLRLVTMCIASAAIYDGAVRFVSDGPLSYNTLAPFLLSGAIAALLVGLAVGLLAPRRLHRRMVPLSLVAGVFGGAAFNWSLASGSDSAPFAGHVVWQVLVCLALHLSFREAPA